MEDVVQLRQAAAVGPATGRTPALDQEAQTAARFVELAEVLEQACTRLQACMRLVAAPSVPEVPEQPTSGSAVLRREGDFWTVRYGGRSVHLRDSRGLQHLRRLVTRPNEPVHVLELVSGVPRRSRPQEDAGLEVLDAQARASYRNRLRALDTAVREAEDDGDGAARERALAERDFLVRELARALGLGGRGRTVADPAERARVAVTKAVHGALGTLRCHHPELADHFGRTVRTGMLCSYAADPAPRWTC